MLNSIQSIKNGSYNQSFGQKYPLADILSVTTGYKIADLDGAYKLLGDMSGINDFKTKVSGLRASLAFVRESCRDKLFQQFPKLKDVNVSTLSPETCKKWLAEQEKVFGKELDVNV